MKAELENKLIEKYPNFFKNRTKSPKESLMCFGCECGDGWFKILENFCGYADTLTKSRNFRVKLKDELKTEENRGVLTFGCPQVVFDQIKEKYGTLRIYWHFEPIEDYEVLKSKLQDPKALDAQIEKFSQIIEAAVEFSEYLSSVTCEITGKPGKLYTNGWCVTLCPEEAIKRFGFEPDEIEI